MPLSFHKMHGAGNDFLLIDARDTHFEIDAHRAGLLADRRRGVGCDQILVLREAQEPGNLLRYEIRNTDGSSAGQCGNGARCIAHYLFLQNEVEHQPFTVESPAGSVIMQRCEDGEYEVDMGIPDFTPERVPLTIPARANHYRVDSPFGEIHFGAVSMGNPHAVITVDDVDDERITAMGAFISTHEGFPQGCNAGFAQVEHSGQIRLRVIERGVGETLACGSGACAAVAVLQRAGQVDDTVEVLLPGGTLVIKWRGNQQTLTMKGPAVHVYRGIMNE